MNIFTCHTLPEYFRGELEERQARNPSYSLRAFAQAIGIGRSTLSSIILESRGLSEERAKLVAKKLRLSDEASLYLSLLAKKSGSQNVQVKSSIHSELRKLALSQNQFKLPMNHLMVLKEWFYSPLLSLIKFSTDFEFTPARAAELLGVSEPEIEVAIDQLEKLGLIEKTSYGYARTHMRILLESEEREVILQDYHREMMNQSRSRLGQGDPKAKFVGTETLAFDVALIPEAKKILDEACDQILALAESSSKKNSIYHLNISFQSLLKEECMPQEASNEIQKHA